MACISDNNANFQLLTSAWAQRASGVLVHSHTEGCERGPLIVPMSDGALVCGDGHELLGRLCSGGTIELHHVEVEGEGDWSATGVALYKHVLDCVGRCGHRLTAHARLSWTALGPAAWALPIRDELAHLAPGFDRGSPLSHALASLPVGVDGTTTAAALSLMGLVRERPLDPSEPRLELIELVQSSQALMDTLVEDLRGDAGASPEAPAVHQLHEAGSAHAAADQRSQAALLEEAAEHIARGDWDGADRLLSDARDIRMDNPAVLASLALVRFHNLRRPTLHRLEDSRQLLHLAAALSPDDPPVIEISDRLHRAEPWFFLNDG